jgi:hypothetical protein
MDSAEDADDGRRHTARRPRYSLKHDGGTAELPETTASVARVQFASVFTTLDCTDNGGEAAGVQPDAIQLP